MTLLQRYEEIVGPQEMHRLRQLASRLQGKRIVHVNSTRSGGGVAEILSWMIPLMQDLGLEARWETSAARASFTASQKLFTTVCKGCPSHSAERLRHPLRNQSQERPEFASTPTSLSSTIRNRSSSPTSRPPGSWTTGCGGDRIAFRPQPTVWKHLERAITHYEAMIFSMAAFTPPTVAHVRHPSVDRPAVGQELPTPRVRATGDVRATRHRSRTTADAASLAVRPIQRSTGSHQSLSTDQALSPRAPARVGRRPGRR